jgi:outer membrane protein assembly factor BamD
VLAVRPTLLGLALALSVAACGGAQQEGTLSYSETARRDYERAAAAFADGDCLTAAPLLTNVRREYPYSRYAALAELRLADCELSQQRYTEAIRAYRAFVRQRPTHPEVATANYSIARAYFQQIPQDFFLSPPPEERDQAATRSALRVVRRFIADHPESEHIAEARRIEEQVVDLLARHELYAASYYLMQQAPQATISRIQVLLGQYEDSRIVPEALLLMGRTYLNMRELDDARLAFGELVDRFPRSGFAAQARSYLVSMGEDPDAPVVDEGGAASPEPVRPAAAQGEDGDDEVEE